MDSIVIKTFQGNLDLQFSNFILKTLPFWKNINATPNILTTGGLFSSLLCIYFLYKKNAIGAIITLFLELTLILLMD